MFRFFENLVNPFAPFREDTPPDRYWPYLRSQLGNFRRVLPVMMVSGMFVAVAETAIIAYSGRVVDLLDTGAEGFWAAHGWELALAALFVLLLRPLMIGLNSLFLENVLVSNMQDQVRWRGHKHLLGQSMSFFQNDFAGRLSNRVMQLGPAVEDTVFMALEALWFSATYVIAAGIIVATMDPVLAIPLVLWVAGFIWYTWNVSTHVGAASEKWTDARSLVTGRIVDAYANVETVKLFGQGNTEEVYVQSAMRRHRARLSRFLRLMTEMSAGRTF